MSNGHFWRFSLLVIMGDPDNETPSRHDVLIFRSDLLTQRNGDLSVAQK